MKTRHLLSGILLFTLSVSAGAFNLAPQKLPFSAANLSFTSQGKQHTLSEYKGKKVMLWLFSTWCHTCVASVKAMQKQQAIWEKSGIVILALRNYKNGGYPGVDMPAFMQRFAPDVKKLNNWVIGEASEKMDEMLNKKKFPDIYFLIDQKGFVQMVNTAPNVTMKKIINFANGQ